MNTTPTTEQRLARLETNARRWKLAAVGLAGLVIGGLVVGFGPTRSDYQPVDDAFLDYLEAGGVLPVPKVVGITQCSLEGETPQRFLVRVWSDGTTEMMLAPPRQSYSWDAQTEVWWPNATTVAGYNPAYAWRPFVDADLSP